MSRASLSSSLRQSAYGDCCFTATYKPDVFEDIEQHFKEQLGITFEQFIGTYERTSLHFGGPAVYYRGKHHT